MKPRLCLLLAHVAALATISAASSTQASSGEAPCSGVAAPEPEDPSAARLLEEEEAKGEAVKRVGFNAWGGKRVGFNAWGGKRGAEGGGYRGGALGWVLGLRDGPRGGGGAAAPGSPEEANKRVGFNAWGGKRSRFNAWGGKRGTESKTPRAFFPWGGKRSSGEEAEDEEGPQGSMDWIYTGQPEEYVGVREGGEGETGEAWGRPFGRGRRSPTSTRNHLIATVEDPTITEGMPWEHKRWNALWRAVNLQPPRQNRRAAGADFFPWGGKRSSL